MTPERWKQIKAVFETALEIAPPERNSFLDSRCGTDTELRSEIESLLHAHDNTGGFLEDLSNAAVPPLEPMESLEDTAAAGARVGPWELVRELGRGGMGAVYLAHRADSEFRKRVAIKLIRHGMESPFAIRRFRNERQILATMEHPNIARLIDGGTTNSGLPYLVMELVEGEPILQYCQARSLSITERIEIFKKVCSAVHYAHRRTIVHRDLKPANVLVKKDGTPKLLDFGVAKLIDPDVNEFNPETTMVGVRMVTPAYASPEQMRGEPATPRSDVYSLGVILSELVAGCKPAALAAAAAGALKTPVRNDIHPTRVGDLRNIVLRAARQEPLDRYGTVEELISDLDRYLAGLPVPSYSTSEPPSVRYADDQAVSGSLAVLPFRLMDRQTGSDAFLATGITDAIITRLSGVARMSIRPTSAVLRYADTADAIAAGYELNVEYVLEGTIQRFGTRVRASVQLVRVRGGSPVWAASFEADSGDLLQLEDSIAEQVAEALVPQLTVAEREQLARRGTASSKAHEAYLRGRHHWSKYTPQDLARALLYFMDAVEQDPNYAQAHSGISDYYNLLGMWGGPPPSESFAAARVAAAKALSINPNLAEAHASYAFAVWALGVDTEEAAHHFQMAVTLNPDYAVAHLGFGLLNLVRGRLEMAVASLQRARNLSPRSPVMASALARAFCAQRNYQRAIDELCGPTRPPENHHAVDEQVAWASVALGRVPEALDAARAAVASSERAASALAALAHAEAAAGNQRAVEQILQEALARRGDTYFAGYSLASIYLAAGRRAEAIRELARARSDSDFWSLFTCVDPIWDPLRHEKAFRALPFVSAPPPPNSVITTAAPVRTSAARRMVLAAAAALVVGAAAWFAFTRLWTRPPSFENTHFTKLTTNGTALRAALSADGKWFAYTGTQDGQLGIWVSPTDQPHSRRLGGPINGDVSSIEFSQGGTYVSFLSFARNEPGNGTLYRIPVAGGAPERLMSGVPGPAALSRDGRRLAFLRPDHTRALDELVIANPDGSGARVIASRRYPDRFAWTSRPSWSEDGSRIALAVEGTDVRGFYTVLMAVNVDTGATTLVRRPRFQYVERIAWVRDALVAIGQEQDSSFQQIWYVPYPGGEPRRIGNDLNDYAGISASADGRALVSVQMQTLSNVYVGKSGSAARQITPGSGRYFDLAWTPDGRLVYASDASGSADIWMMDSDGSGQHQLTSGKGRSYSPTVSPDGKYIAYHSNRTGSWNIWRMNSTGGNEILLTHDTRDSNWPQFTPDGRSIIYHHTEPNAMFTLWKLPTEGGTPTRITDKLTMRPALAPDGRIACWYSEESGSPKWKMAIVAPGGGAPIAVFDPPPSASPDTTLRWTSKGDAITLMVTRNGVSNLFEQPLSGAPARALTHFSSGQIFSFDWSRDGQLAYSHGMTSSDVVLIREVPKP